MIAYFSLITGLFAISWIIVTHYKRRNFPPNYTGVPLLGVLPFLCFNKNPFDVFWKWARKLGPIMTLRVGHQDWVFANNFEWNKKMFIDYSQYTSTRTWGELFRINNGFLFTSDYAEQKKALSMSIRKFFTNNKLEEMIVKEVSYMVKEIKQEEDGPVDIQKHVMGAVENLILTMMFGKRFDYNDNWFKKYTSLMRNILSNPEISPFLIALQFAPRMRFIPGLSGKWKQFLKYSNTERDMLFDKVKEKRECLLSGDAKAKPCGILDDLLMYKNAKTGEKFTLNKIIGLSSEIFVGGTENPTISILWMLLYLACNRETQNEVYEEINNVMGTNPPKIKHKLKTDLISSFIDEALRLRAGLPFGVPHTVTKEFQADGYQFKKGQFVISNVWATHRDEIYFENPEEFRPARFIDPKNGKYIKSKHLIPFGIGPRLCLGYKVGEMQMFLILCGILQKYEILPYGEMPSFEDGNMEFVYKPLKYYIKVKSR